MSNIKKVSNYEVRKRSAEAYYKGLGRVRCPALNNEYVHFNAEGFNHLLYSKNKARSQKQQLVRFGLLADAVKIIKKTTTVQELDVCIEMKLVKRNKKKEELAMEVHYWSFIAVIRNIRIKVIIRQLGSGQKHFYSVIPFWSTSHYGDIKVVSVAKGNLKED